MRSELGHGLYRQKPVVRHVESPSQPVRKRKDHTLKEAIFCKKLGMVLLESCTTTGEPCLVESHVVTNVDVHPRNTKGGRNNHESDVQYEISRLLYEVPSELLTQLFKMAHL